MSALTVSAADGRLSPDGPIAGVHRLSRFADDLIVISFQTLGVAQDWYSSAAYQALVPLRRQGANGEVFLVEDVDRDHKATDILQGSPF